MTQYAESNPKSKAALKRMLAEGRKLRVWTETPFGRTYEAECSVALSGPHYPAPHRWYAKAKVDAEGFIIPGSVK